MDKKEKIFDVEYQDIQNEIYLTAPQLAKKINDTDTRVRYWGDQYADLMGLEKINNSIKYKESDVYKFAFVKDLFENKKMKHDQIKEYVSKHGFKYAEYDSGLIDPKDPLGFQVLASALTLEVNEKLKEFANVILSEVSDQLNNHLQNQRDLNLQTKAEIETAVDEIITEKLNENLNNITNAVSQSIDSVNINIDSVKSHIDKIEQQTKEKDIQMVETLKQHMEERKQTQELIGLQQGVIQSQKKGFFGRLFGK